MAGRRLACHGMQGLWHRRPLVHPRAPPCHLPAVLGGSCWYSNALDHMSQGRISHLLPHEPTACTHLQVRRQLATATGVGRTQRAPRILGLLRARNRRWVLLRPARRVRLGQQLHARSDLRARGACGHSGGRWRGHVHAHVRVYAVPPPIAAFCNASSLPCPPHRTSSYQPTPCPPSTAPPTACRTPPGTLPPRAAPHPRAGTQRAAQPRCLHCHRPPRRGPGQPGRLWVGGWVGERRGRGGVPGGTCVAAACVCRVRACRPAAWHVAIGGGCAVAPPYMHACTAWRRRLIPTCHHVLHMHMASAVLRASLAWLAWLLIPAGRHVTSSTRGAGGFQQQCA